LRSTLVKEIGVSAFEMTNADRRMCFPIDAAKIVDFDVNHQTPQDTIKEMRTDLDLMNKIIREKILETQREMKSAFDEKVTPYQYEVGGVVLLNDQVESRDS